MDDARLRRLTLCFATAISAVLDGSYIIEAERRARRFSGAWTGTSGTLAADVIRLIEERKELMSQLDDANEALRKAEADRLANTPADDPKLAGYSPLAGCQPAQECAAQVLTDAWQQESCCDGGRQCSKNESPYTPADWILRGDRELREQRLRGDGVMNAVSETYAELPPPVYSSAIRPGSREFLAVLDELRELHCRKSLDYGVDEDALSNIRSSADIVNMPAWAGCVLRMMDKMHRLKAYFRRGKVEFDGLSDTLKDIACYAVIAEVLRRESD